MCTYIYISLELKKFGLEANKQEFKRLFQNDSGLSLQIAKGFLANISNAFHPHAGSTVDMSRSISRIFNAISVHKNGTLNLIINCQKVS
jgi:hypothetical protein